jgi:DNA repair protein RadA/Sms
VNAVEAAAVISSRYESRRMISILLIVVYVLSFDYSTSFHQSYICASSISTLLKASRSGIKASSKAPKEIFFCDQCGVEHIKWEGRCTSCREWNTVKPFKAAKLGNIGIGDTRQLKANPLSSINGLVSGSTLQSSYSPWVGHAIGGPATMIPMEDVELNVTTYRLKLFSDEMNRVLGGGLVRGSVSLLAGDPGIGKSTLLLQLASSIANDKSAMDRTVVYISGEENPEQIAARAKRLNLSAKKTFLICDIDVDNAIESILSMPAPPALIIVDSIQTMRTAACTNGMGSITQIRESAARFVELAKSSGTAVLLIGHVTKAGDIAGPRVLEHMVDVVLHLEGSERSEYRLLKGVKNRFGSTAEVGVFSMNGEGMADVPNPSELFMSSNVVSTGAEGSAVAVIMEGTRPILAEIQCLVGAPSALPAEAKISPRRATDGFPLQRLQLLCAGKKTSLN